MEYGLAYIYIAWDASHTHNTHSQLLESRTTYTQYVHNVTTVILFYAISPSYTFVHPLEKAYIFQKGGVGKGFRDCVYIVPSDTQWESKIWS